MRALASASLVAFTLGAAFGQPTTEQPGFEVASIKMYPAGSRRPEGGEIGIKLSAGGVNIRYIRLDNCLAWAYDIRGRISGPDWIHSERYDIVAKAAAPVPQARLKLMFQTLLADRFKLTLHRETKEFAVVALVVAKNGPKNLHSVEAGGPPGMQQVDGKLVLKSVSMSRFAEALKNRPPYGLNGETVVDQTGLPGVYDITLNVKGFNADDPAFISNFEELRSALFDFFSNALGKQYGLKLEHRKLPLESLVIDQASRVPTEN